jgi:hypothetical protein
MSQDYATITDISDWKATRVDERFSTREKMRGRRSWQVGLYKGEVIAVRHGHGSSLFSPRFGDSLTVPDGQLYCSDSGEFGGSLSWVDSAKHSAEVLLERQTSHLFRWSNGYIALGGLSHLGHSEGHITLLTRRDGDKWQLQTVAELPDAPEAVFQAKDRSLVIATNYRLVRLKADLEIELITSDCFWQGLYVNSLLKVMPEKYYLGMRGGVGLVSLEEAQFVGYWLDPPPLLYEPYDDYAGDR